MLVHVSTSCKISICELHFVFHLVKGSKIETLLGFIVFLVFGLLVEVGQFWSLCPGLVPCVVLQHNDPKRHVVPTLRVNLLMEFMQADARVAPTTAEILRVPGKQVRLSFVLHVFCEFWLLVLAMRFGTIFSLMGSLSPTTSCFEKSW